MHEIYGLFALPMAFLFFLLPAWFRSSSGGPVAEEI